MSYELAISEIKGILRDVGPIRAVKDPADQITYSHTALVLPFSGEYHPRPMGEVMTGLHQVAIEIHMMREKSLEKAVIDSIPYGDTVPKALFAALHDNTYTAIQTFSHITYSYGDLGWQGKDTVGWRFVMHNIKIQENLT